jgi:elongation factor 3
MTLSLLCVSQPVKQFVCYFTGYATGPEIWNMEAGQMTHKGKAAVTEDSFNFKSPKGSGSTTPVRSRVHTPVGSTVGTPIASATEGKEGDVKVTKKKKLTRNQLKAQEERRRLRQLNWLTFGGSKPEDTESDADS